MAQHLRNDRHLSVHDLKRRISEFEIDTVVIAFTDMQGRLQGKRMHAAYFVDHVLEYGTEGCNYLLAVDVDMNTVDGYALTSWEQGYGDLEFALDLDTIRLLPHLPGTALVQCDLVRLDHEPVEPGVRRIGNRPPHPGRVVLTRERCRRRVLARGHQVLPADAVSVRPAVAEVGSVCVCAAAATRASSTVPAGAG